MVLGLDVLDTLKALLSSLKLLLSTTELVEKLTFVELELLHCIFHLSHFLGLIIYDVSNTLFNIYLLSVGIQVS